MRAPPYRVASPLRDLFLDMNGRALDASPCGTAAPFDAAWDLLPTLRLPVSIVVGELDMPGLVSAATSTAERAPNAKFRILPETAHLPMLEPGLRLPERHRLDPQVGPRTRPHPLPHDRRCLTVT